MSRFIAVITLIFAASAFPWRSKAAERVGSDLKGRAKERGRQDFRLRFLPAWLSLSASLSFRVASPTVVEGYPAPALLCWGPSLKLGYRFPSVKWLPETEIDAGLVFSQSRMAQTSEVLPAVGNMTGSRTSLFSPFVRAIHDGDYLAQVALEWNGSYALSRPTVEGGSLQYDSPRGVSAEVGYQVGRWFGVKGLFAGALLAATRFTARTDSVEGTSASNLTLTQFGLVITYVH